MKTYEGVEVKLHSFLTSAAAGGEPSAHNPATPEKQSTVPM